MRMSNLLMPTLREVPAEAEITSHKLMLRAGLIRKLAAGIYSYLPLGLRTLQKVEQIVREEMDNTGTFDVCTFAGRGLSGFGQMGSVRTEYVQNERQKRP